jgi:hypothetical protein
MPDAGRTAKLGPAVRLALLAMVLAGCESTGNWLSGRKTADAAPLEINSPESASYVSELTTFINGDPATQAELLADARDRADLTPSPQTRLRYGLMLATPGHAQANAAEAQQIFRELLSHSELLSPVELSLVTIHLKDVDERLVLNSEVQRLRSANTRVASTEDQAVAQRIASVEAENRRLRQSLAEAEQKLEAITSIEREIREQPDGN